VPVHAKETKSDQDCAYVVNTEVDSKDGVMHNEIKG